MLKISQKGPFWKYSLKRSFLFQVVDNEEDAHNTYNVVIVPLLADLERMAHNLFDCHQIVEEVMVEVVEDVLMKM